MLRELQEWLAHPIPRMLLVGELQDGLAFDSAFQKVTGKPLTHWIIPVFARQSRHQLVFLTKSTEIEHAFALPPTRQVVFSWSVNAEEVAQKWEQGAPLPSQRFDAAERMARGGWPIRFRLDPMVPYPGWKHGYAAAIEHINGLNPEMVTLGALRATSYRALRNAAKANGRRESIFEYLTEGKDPSGFKYRIPFEKQVDMFRFVIERLKPGVIPALCKEDRAVWRALGLRFDGCHCLVGRRDEVVEERRSEMQNHIGQRRASVRR
jgi:spore photoproduct lyase